MQRQDPENASAVASVNAEPDDGTALRTRRPRESAAQRRAQILAAARRLFAERGFHATTTRDLAEAADINDGLLYRYFANKQEILTALADEAVAVFESAPALPVDAPLPLPLETLLTLAGSGFVERARANLDLLTILIADSRALGADTRFVAFIDRAASGLAIHLDRTAGGTGQAEGLHAGYLTARAFFGALIAFILLQDQLGLARLHPLDATEYVRHLARMTARAVEAGALDTTDPTDAPNACDGEPTAT
jgi:AcrR family transcriptional regulator